MAGEKPQINFSFSRHFNVKNSSIPFLKRAVAAAALYILVSSLHVFPSPTYVYVVCVENFLDSSEKVNMSP